jgi:hypothetical protein
MHCLIFVPFSLYGQTIPDSSILRGAFVAFSVLDKEKTQLWSHHQDAWRIGLPGVSYDQHKAASAG